MKSENVIAVIFGISIALVILWFLSFSEDEVTGSVVADTNSNNEIPPIEDTPSFKETEVQQQGVFEPNKQKEVGTQEQKDAELRTFEWEYGDRKWYLKLELSPEWYDYYKQRGQLVGNNGRHRNYDIYVTDPYDDDLIKLLADELTKLGTKNDLQYEEIPYFTASFVQSLPYTSDSVTAGFDEYPRFPFETLYDDGGDCEDTSILVSAILKEMGYGVILVNPPGHMAVGVKCYESVGTYYKYEGEKYCYLETTGEDYEIGQIPEEYEDKSAQLIPLYNRPLLDVNFNGNYSYDSFSTNTNLEFKIKNLGSDWAENVQVYVALQTREEGMVWSQFTSEEFDIKPEETYSYSIGNLNAPVGEDFRIYVMAYGSNVISNEIVSGWVTWESS